MRVISEQVDSLEVFQLLATQIIAEDLDVDFLKGSVGRSNSDRAGNCCYVGGVSSVKGAEEIATIASQIARDF